MLEVSLSLGITPKSRDALGSLRIFNAIAAATENPGKMWIDLNRPDTKTSIGILQSSLQAALGSSQIEESKRKQRAVA